MARDDELRKLLDFIDRQPGWSVEMTRNGHLRVKAPGGEIIIAASTPSDHRSMRNFLSRLRRAGLVYDRRREPRR